MTKAIANKKLKQSIFDCLVKLELVFQDYSLIKNYNDYWRSHTLTQIRIYKSYLKYFTKNRKSIIIKGMETLKEQEPEFYDIYYGLFREIEVYLNYE